MRASSRSRLREMSLFPDDPHAFVATGFLATGPWDFVGHQELREGTTDKENTRLLDRDDMVATTISTFTSMTAHCARCHNHKFDPIPQQDYYNLQAVFAGVDRADRPYDDDPAMHHKRQQLLEQKRAVQIRLQPLQDKVEFATSAEIVDLDSSIQDAGLQIAHIGPDPKTKADAELKRELETRRDVDRKRKKELVDAIVGPGNLRAIERVQSELKTDRRSDQAAPTASLRLRRRRLLSTGGYLPAFFAAAPDLRLTSGSLQSPGKPAHAGGLSCVAGLKADFNVSDSADEGARRAAWPTGSPIPTMCLRGDPS